MPRFDVEIEKIVAGGDGLARHDGRVVFVPATVPGERHTVETTVDKKDYARARSVRCHEPSPDRREPPCPYVSACGGCPLMHLSPDAQLEVKRDIFIETLRRSGAVGRAQGGLEPVAMALTPSPSEGYRTRVRFHVAQRKGVLHMGFRRRGSHDVEDVEHCRLASDELNDAWRRIRSCLLADPSRARGLQSIEIQESSQKNGRMTARFVVRSSDGLRRFDDAFLSEVSGGGLVGFVAVSERGAEVRMGGGSVHHEVAGFSFRQSTGAFFQTNRFLLEPLVQSVVSRVEGARVVDLYCGVGLFTLPAGDRAGEAVGVESSPVAVADAETNGKGLPSVRFIRADVTEAAQAFRFDEGDSVIVDPPRGGLPRALRDAIARSPVRELVYVSCDPPAFGRDAAFLAKSGFELGGLHLLDLFPNTHHFETVATLRRATLDSVPRARRY